MLSANETVAGRLRLPAWISHTFVYMADRSTPRAASARLHLTLLLKRYLKRYRDPTSKGKAVTDASSMLSDIEDG